ncbi:MAG: ABC transporter ATP-binding protein [Thermacetogeniaceae bacterium]
MLTLKKVSLIYRNGKSEVQALKDIDLKIEKGKSYAVIGPSGCGKTSLLYLIAGLIQPTTGEICVEGQGLENFRQKTALILQEYGLLPWKTVWENAALGLRIRNITKEKANQMLLPILEELELTDCLKRYPTQLSGGQKQRVALARALALNPELLLMDEPLSALDALTRENLQELILKLWKKHQITLVLVTHSIEEAVYLGQEIIILTPQPGKIQALISNSGMGSKEYRHNPLFHQKCSEIRSILEENN